ncbi:hypothetical protein [Halorubrum kocurii]|uniref:Adhesin domain-containing protein n=1 Tax=Halorubrum kocurii JCM 14978 TaxID=1230456 RepID=M0PIW1_9EURY|nr:hypothetical protein [Halorubrum kocurii]EMA69991.1 hypothetical protein C468_00610 [Halorubrum kocurii JCM 14978]
MNRRQFLGASGLVTVSAFSGCLGGTPFGRSRIIQTTEESFPAADVETVRVTNDIGDVLVTATDVDNVRARVVKRSTEGQSGLDDIEATVSLDDGVLTVETRIDDDAQWFTRSSPSTDVTVSVPEGDAGPAVDSVTSELGDVTLLNTRGDTRVRTNLGNVTANGVNGYPDLRSNLGEVLSSGSTGLDRARSDLGAVKVEVWDVRDDIEIRTDLGDVAVGIADDLDVDVLAESVSDINSTLALTNVESSSDRLAGQLNAGGSEVHVLSEFGDVSLRPLQRE